MPDPVVFPIEPADESFSETYAFRTDVQTSDNDTEQRVRLRQFPVGSFEFNMLAEGRLAQLVNALLYGQQPAKWVVPWWPYARHPINPVHDGDYEVDVDCSGWPFCDYLDPVVLWRSPFDYQLLYAEEEPDREDSIQFLAAPVVGEWDPANTLVMPARYARLGGEAPIAWESGALVSARLAWTLEPLVSEGFPFAIDDGTVSTLEIEPSRDGPVEDRIAKRFILLESGMGAVDTAARGKAPALTRTLVWKCFTQPEVAALRTWLDERMGRAVPFLMPAWEQDLTLAAPALSAATAIVVRSFGYTAQMFPTVPNRRRLRLRSRAGATVTASVTASIDNGDGTETLTLAAPLGTNVDATWDVTFLRLCRLDDDAPRIDWSGSDYAEARIPIRELPSEDTP